MKVAFLALRNSIHTARWANSLHQQGLEVHLLSSQKAIDYFHPEIHQHQLKLSAPLGYYLNTLQVKQILKKINPDLLHAHYASGYGTLARLVNFHPYILSVWGSDVYDFPQKSFFHRNLVKNNLLKADAIASTSRCMAEQTRSIAPERSDISITPFGVDTQYYVKFAKRKHSNDQIITIGTVKKLSKKYGVDTLLKAFALLLQNLEKEKKSLAQKIRLRLVGDGPQMQRLKELATELNIAHLTSFVGRVPHESVPIELSKLDIYVALSRLESFGVAIIEASAASRPVVVSDAGGLPEVVIHNQTGLIVPRENAQAAANALHQLVVNPELRNRMGVAGREYVSENYDWSYCVNKMLNFYQQTINHHKTHRK